MADNSAAVSFGAIEEAVGQSLLEVDGDEVSIHSDEEEDDEEYEGAEEENGIDFRFVEEQEDILATFRGNASPPKPAEAKPQEREQLESALKELLACRQLLDRAMKDT